MAAEGLAKERETLVVDRVGKERRCVIERVIAQVGLPVRGRHVGQHAVELGEELRLAQRESFNAGDALGSQHPGPREVRRGLVGVCHGHIVVLVLRVATLDRRQRCLGKARFKIEHRLRLGLGGGGFHTTEHQHALDVGEECVANFLVLVFQVVRALRQRQAAFAGVGDDLAGVLEIFAREEVEHELVAMRERVLQVLGNGCAIGKRVDFCERRLHRGDAVGIEPGFIQAQAIEVAQLLLIAAGRILGGRGGFDDLLLHEQGPVAQDIEVAPGGLVVGNRIGGEPLAVDVRVEVLADRRIGIEVGDGEARQGRQLGLIDHQLGGFRSGGSGSGRGGFVFLAGAQRGGDGQRQRQVFQGGKGHIRLQAPQGNSLKVH